MFSYDGPERRRDYPLLVKRYERLLEVTRTLTSTLDLPSLLQTIIHAAAELTDTEAASILLLDANTGQNMLQQARIFQEVCGVTGLVLAKLDGTAKGGAVISVCNELKLPLRFIGLGEKLEDLDEFDPASFASALFESNAETA